MRLYNGVLRSCEIPNTVCSLGEVSVRKFSFRLLTPFQCSCPVQGLHIHGVSLRNRLGEPLVLTKLVIDKLLGVGPMWAHKGLSAWTFPRPLIKSIGPSCGLLTLRMAFAKLFNVSNAAQRRSGSFGMDRICFSILWPGKKGSKGVFLAQSNFRVLKCMVCLCVAIDAKIQASC